MLAMYWQHDTSTPQTIEEVFRGLPERFIAAVPGLLNGFIVFAIFWLLAIGGARLIAYAAPRMKADTGVVLLLSRVYYYAIIIFGLLTALSTAGLNVTALITGLGLTGFALGFALKDVLSNLLSGLMLLLYRPFTIGDYILVGGHEGTIETISMRHTILRDDAGRLVIIPNSKLITEVVVDNNHVPRAPGQKLATSMSGAPAANAETDEAAAPPASLA